MTFSTYPCDTATLILTYFSRQLFTPDSITQTSEVLLQGIDVVGG